MITLMVAAAASAERVAADPDFGLDPPSPTLGAVPATPLDVLSPATGWAKWGVQAPPVMTIPGAALGLPALGAIDDFSYGDEVPMTQLALAYSVGRNALGIPGSALSIEAAVPEGAVGTDLFTVAGPLLPGPCGYPPILPNALLVDGDGTTAGGAPPKLGLGVLGELPPLAYPVQDNISGVDLEAYAGSPVYFTVDAGTAGPMGVSPADILAYFPAVGGWVVWAPGALLGLLPNDDIDALAVGDPTPADLTFTPGADWVFVSLKPGSPSLGVLPHCALIPGPASPGDLWWSNGGPLAPFADAEMLGLATLRSGLGPADDVLDALDLVDVPLPADTDGDGADNAIDFDDDNDACTDVKEPTLAPPINPLDPWDFYSVPVPALIAAPNPLVVFKDDVVAAGDAQSVFAYFKAGSVAGKPSYEQDLNGNGVKDGWEYDRSVAGPGMSGPPDGAIGAADAQLAFAQFKAGYKC